MERKSHSILLIMLIILIFYLLAILESILQPLVLAMLFAIMLQPLIVLLEKIKIPRFIIVPFLSVLTLAILVMLMKIVAGSFVQIFSEREFLLQRLSYKLGTLTEIINQYSPRELSSKELLTTIQSVIKTSEISKSAVNLFSKVGSLVGSFAGSFVMFAIYFVILLSGMSNYKLYIAHVGGQERAQKLISNYESIQKSVFSYLTIKTLISITTGILAGIALSLFGIKFALLFGFLTFLLNFIPTFGSIIASLPPILMAIVQFDTFIPAIALAITLLTIQLIMGNVIEPSILGNRLRFNTVTVIFGLVFWGYLWGITGMILSVPLLAVIKLSLESFTSTTLIARIMGYPEIHTKAKDADPQEEEENDQD